MSYAQLFLQNFLIEWLVLLLFFHRQGLARMTLVALLANTLTHPLVVFGFLGIPEMPLWQALISGEIFAILVEALIYGKVLPTRWYLALAASCLANLISWEVGPRFSYLLLK